MWRPVIMVVLGIWLAISGVAWPHTPPQSWNSIIVGALIAVLGVLSVGYDWAKHVAVGLAAWLVLSLLLFSRHAPATFWNNIFVAFIVFVTSVMDSPRAFHAPADKGMAGHDNPVQ